MVFGDKFEKLHCSRSVPCTRFPGLGKGNFLPFCAHIHDEICQRRHHSPETLPTVFKRIIQYLVGKHEVRLSKGFFLTAHHDRRDLPHLHISRKNLASVYIQTGQVIRRYCHHNEMQVLEIFLTAGCRIDDIARDIQKEGVLLYCIFIHVDGYGEFPADAENGNKAINPAGESGKFAVFPAVFEIHYAKVVVGRYSPPDINPSHKITDAYFLHFGVCMSFRYC